MFVPLFNETMSLKRVIAFLFSFDRPALYANESMFLLIETVVSRVNEVKQYKYIYI